MEELEEVVNLAKQRSRDIVESGEEHTFIILILTPDGIAIGHPIGDKSAFRSSLIQLLRELHAYAYVMVNEAWEAHISKDSPLLADLFAGRKTVRELSPDDKEEILTVTAVEKDKSYRCWTAKIGYTTDDKRYLCEWQELDGGSLEGRMVIKEW